MSGPSLDQQRAKHALQRVDAVKGSKAAAKYAGYSKGLPAAILANGLGQALATELAAAKDDAHDAHTALAADVARWLLSSPGRPKGWEQPKHTSNDQAAIAKELLNRLVAGDQQTYVWAQAEAIAYVGWLKKLAVAFLSEEATAKQKGFSDEGAASDGR